MTRLEDQYQQFTEVLSEEELRRLADQYGVADQRERKPPIRIFFLLMVLSAGQPTVRGALFQWVAFFVAALSGLFPTARAFILTKIALSLKLKEPAWFFFRGDYSRLLARDTRLLPPSPRKQLDAFKETFLLEATISRIHKALNKLFQSVHKDQAACKVPPQRFLEESDP